MAKKKKNDVDKFARLISIISLILAVLAVGLPYYQTEKNLQEDIAINLTNGCNNTNQIKLINRLGVVYGIVQLPYNLTISNNGNRTSSIIDIETEQMDKNGRISKFSGIEGDIVDVSGESVSLPININSGESKSFIYYIGAFIEPEI